MAKWKQRRASAAKFTFTKTFVCRKPPSDLLTRLLYSSSPPTRVNGHCIITNSASPTMPLYVNPFVNTHFKKKNGTPYGPVDPLAAAVCKRLPDKTIPSLILPSPVVALNTQLAWVSATPQRIIPYLDRYSEAARLLPDRLQGCIKMDVPPPNMARFHMSALEARDRNVYGGNFTVSHFDDTKRFNESNMYTSNFHNRDIPAFNFYDRNFANRNLYDSGLSGRNFSHSSDVGVTYGRDLHRTTFHIRNPHSRNSDIQTVRSEQLTNQPTSKMSYQKPRSAKTDKMQVRISGFTGLHSVELGVAYWYRGHYLYGRLGNPVEPVPFTTKGPIQVRGILTDAPEYNANDSSLRSEKDVLALYKAQVHEWNNKVKTNGAATPIEPQGNFTLGAFDKGKVPMHPLSNCMYNMSENKSPIVRY